MEYILPGLTKKIVACSCDLPSIKITQERDVGSFFLVITTDI